MPQTPHVHIPFGSSRVQISLRRTLFLIKNLAEEKEEQEEEEERGISEEKMKMLRALQPVSMQGGGMEAKQARFSVHATLKSFVCATSQQGRGAGETNKVFSHLRNTFICATSQQGHRGRRKKQGFPCNLEIFYLRNQPAGQ